MDARLPSIAGQTFQAGIPLPAITWPAFMRIFRPELFFAPGGIS
jgi:hypothetical protein